MKLHFRQPLFQSSLSHGFSEIIQICWFAAQLIGMGRYTYLTIRYYHDTSVHHYHRMKTVWHQSTARSTENRRLPLIYIWQQALRRMISVYVIQSTAWAIREQMDTMLSNGSRGTLMSYTDHSVQRRLKSNPLKVEWLCVLSNGSHDTLMSYTDHSVQRRLKSNPLKVEWLCVLSNGSRGTLMSKIK